VREHAEQMLDIGPLLAPDNLVERPSEQPQDAASLARIR
jgi:hypothetical protein